MDSNFALFRVYNICSNLNIQIKQLLNQSIQDLIIIFFKQFQYNSCKIQKRRIVIIYLRAILR